MEDNQRKIEKKVKRFGGIEFNSYFCNMEE